MAIAYFNIIIKKKHRESLKASFIILVIADPSKVIFAPPLPKWPGIVDRSIVIFVHKRIRHLYAASPLLPSIAIRGPKYFRHLHVPTPAKRSIVIFGPKIDICNLRFENLKVYSNSIRQSISNDA